MSRGAGGCLTRRRVVAAALPTFVAAGLGMPLRAARADQRSHSRAGPVAPPGRPPPTRLTTHQNQATDLRRLVIGKVSAVQLMFTTCSALCPVQGAVFADTLTRLGRASSRVRLLSISIDPLGDDAKALHAWLARFGPATPRWLAAVPHVADADVLGRFLRGNSPAGSGDAHTTQVFLFDPRGELVMISPELPSGAQIAALLLDLDARP